MTLKAWKFVCPQCGERDCTVAPVDQPPGDMTCKCGRTMDRDDFIRPADSGHGITGCETARTFWSSSLAISPDQAAEHRQLFPHVEVAPDGQLGFHSHKDRERYCEATGFVKVSKEY